MGGKVVLFRVDANRATGLGHLMRSLALAEEFAARGWSVAFAGNLDRDACGRIARAGAALLAASTGEAEERLLVSAAEGIGPAVLVVDTYLLGDEYYLRAARLIPVVVAVDDVGHSPPGVRVLINYGPAASGLGYRVRPETHYLLGPRYALLPRTLRARGPRRVRREVSHILVTVGGSDPNLLLPRILAGLQRAGVGARWDVVLGPGMLGEMGAPDCGRDPRVRLHEALPSLLPLLQESDLVVCAAGVTACEAAAVGTPAILLVQAENQEPNARELAALGAAINLGLGRYVTPEAVAEAVVRLARDWEARREMSGAGRALFDGYGPARCADAIEGVLERVGG
ncbi:MAG: hypothetical protein H5T97_09620 [Firmicutes bacterium]|nr:hypothetical protein [Bacillota bacterium]